MENMKIIDEILKSCRYDENYELDDVIEKLEDFKLVQKQVKNLTIPVVSGSLPSKDEVETASIDYREDSDEYDDEDMIVVNWYDKQEAFQAGVKWFIENYR